MVLLSLGADFPESQLREDCDCTLLGTDALKAVDAARKLGFARSGKHTLTLDELKSAVASGLNPIVFVSLLPIDARKDIHAVVVVDFIEKSALVLDPLFGERLLPIEAFNSAWAIGHNLAIIIER